MSRKQKRNTFRILLALLLSVIIYFLPLNGIWQLIAFIVPYLVIGYDVLWSALRNILHGQIFDEKFLMALATIGAFAVGEYLEAAAVMLFYQVGELFESIAVGKSRRSIAALMDIRPDHALVLRDGQEVLVAPEEVDIGELILVKPGEKIPLDGEIVKGQTTVNTAALTGESLPVDKGVGDTVISSSINLSSAITMRAQSLYENSTVAKILELVENSAQKKARAENFITRFARYYTPCVVIGAVLLALIPPLLFGQPWSAWINRALIFLVVSCPCALVVSVPLSFFAGIGRASRQGILVKGANYLEALAKVDTVVFDKTGTLTKGSFRVSAILAKDMEEEALLTLAAAIESNSTHPVAESILAAYGKPIDKARIQQVKELPGMGLEAILEGETFYAGNSALMDKFGIPWEECPLIGTTVHLAKKKEYLGCIVINDEIKPESCRTIAALKDLGVTKTVMLTGDTRQTAQSVAQSIGVDEVRAELLPVQKVEAIEELLEQGRNPAFVGDGINDAPVLSRANVGIAMGAMGSDAAIESADIVLMDDNPLKLSGAINIARKTMAIVRENILFSLIVKALILILSALGLTNMWIAVFGDVGVLVLTILNAMRLLINKKPMLSTRRIYDSTNAYT